MIGVKTDANEDLARVGRKPKYRKEQLQVVDEK